MKTKIITTTYQFGSVFECNGVKYIFSHNFANGYILFTMDGADFDLFHPKELTWLYQLPVKFYKGYDYVITDDNLILRQLGKQCPDFTDAEKAEILRRAEDSPYHYLRLSYNRGSITHEDYKRISNQCLVQHFMNHKKDYLICYA